MFNFLGRTAVGHPRKVILAWIVLAAVLTCFAPNWDKNSQDDDIRFLPGTYPSVRAYQLMEQAFPNDVSASRMLLVVERTDAVLLRSDFQLVDKLVAKLNELSRIEPDLGITGVASYRDGPVGKRLTSYDKKCTLVQISLASPYLAVKTRDTVDRAEALVRPLIEEVGLSAPSVLVTGPAGIGRDLVSASAKSLDDTTLATVILVVVVLLIVYRSPLLALIPLITIGIAVWVSLKILALLTLIPGVHLVNVAQVFAVVILFGAGTDYCLFLISRYREELETGQTKGFALRCSVSSVGGALAASAGTVMCGLGMMGFAEFGKIRCAGPVIALGLFVALAASLTLTPSLLRLVGRKVFWPQRIQPVVPGRVRNGFWEMVSGIVVRRPGLVFTLALLPLLPLAFIGTRVIPTFKPIGDLSSTSESVRGLEVIQTHFTAGETGPLTVLLSSPKPWTSPEGRDVLTHLTSGFGLLPNVAEVRSLIRPLGNTPIESVTAKPERMTFTGTYLTKIQQNFDSVVASATKQIAEGHYLAETETAHSNLYVTRLDVVFKTDPFDAESIETLNLIETWMHELLPSRAVRVGLIQAEVYGVTVHTRDMANVVARDRVLVNALVLGGVFIILLVLVRSLWLAGYLLATVILSYYATLGMTALFASWMTGRAVTEIEWRVPFFLFTILIAVGEDYNILLVTRIMQERKNHGMVEAIRRGLAATGGTITACGLIMAGTFGTLMLAKLMTLMQIGFALGVGVLMDTFLIRPFLVPSFMVLVYRDQESEADEEPDILPMIRPVRPPMRKAG